MIYVNQGGIGRSLTVSLMMSRKKRTEDFY